MAKKSSSETKTRIDEMLEDNLNRKNALKKIIKEFDKASTENKNINQPKTKKS